MNWGIIGLGKISNKFVTALKTLADANIYAVASRSQEKANAFAKEHKAEIAYGNYDALFQDKNVDIVYIGTPHVFHSENAIAAMQHGKHILCEKPISINQKLAQSMFDCAKTNNVFLMEALWTRFIPSFIEAKRIIENGEIGEIKSIHANFGFQSKSASSSRVFNHKLGGGSLLDVGIYPIFLATNLLGKPKNIRAVATLNEQGTDDNCGVLLQYENAIANLSSSLVSNQKVEATIFGTKGTLQLNNRFHEPTSISIIRNFKVEKILEFEEASNGMQHQIHEVHHCINNKKIQSKMMSWSDSLLLQEVMDEVRKQIGLKYEQD